MCDLGYPPTLPMVHSAAKAILRRRASVEQGISISDTLLQSIKLGKHQASRFMQREKDLSHKRITYLKSKRKVQSNPQTCYDFLEKLRWLVWYYKIDFKDIYNMDEKGHARGGVIGRATKGVYRTRSRVNRITCGDRKWVTQIKFIGTRGVIGPPFIIHDGSAPLKNIAAAMDRSFKEEIGLWKQGVSLNRQLDNNYGLTQLTNIFKPQTSK